MYMINSYVRGNLNSRLFQKVREENGLTFTAYTHITACVILPGFFIYMHQIAAQTERVYELIFDIIDEFNEKGIDVMSLQGGKQTKQSLYSEARLRATRFLTMQRLFCSQAVLSVQMKLWEHYESKH